MSSYDVILIGLPIWAFAPVPAVNTFLDNITNASGKRFIVLITYGSGAGVGKCLKAVRSVLEQKGAARIDEITIPNRKNGR